MSANEWHVGMHVECIDDAPGLFVSDPLVRRGQIYTIAAIVCHGDGIIVEEISLPKGFSGWSAYRFRPVQKRKTDISIFTRMLNPQKQGVDA